MDDETTTKPTPAPAPARPGRRRRHEPPKLPHLAHRTPGDASAKAHVRATEQVVAQTEGGGGSSGRGPIDDDGGGRRPDRNDDDARHLLIALGLIALGATVLRAGLLARAGRPPRTA